MKKLCIKCGNCCRVGGVCDLLGWRSLRHWREKDNEFTGTCPELQDDNLCGIAVKVRAGEITNLHESCLGTLDKIFKGICTNPEVRQDLLAEEPTSMTYSTECKEFGLCLPCDRHGPRKIETIPEG